MKIFRTLVVIGFFIVCAVILPGQEASKSRISSITFRPSEPVQPSGDCKSSTGGYLEKNGRITITNGEISKFVSEKLRDGYILTMYPAAKDGIFVNAECTNVSVP